MSLINTWQIHMQGDSSTSCLFCVTINKTQGKCQGHQKYENRCLSHNFWIRSRRDFWLDAKCYWWKYLSVMMYDVPFLHHMTSNKTYDFCMFSKFINSVPIDLKILTHIDRTYTMCHAKKCPNQNNVTRISIATKYPIIKHMTFFQTLTAAISPINTWWIAMKYHKEIPVLHAYFVDKGQLAPSCRALGTMIKKSYHSTQKAVSHLWWTLNTSSLGLGGGDHNLRPGCRHHLAGTFHTPTRCL